MRSATPTSGACSTSCCMVVFWQNFSANSFSAAPSSTPAAVSPALTRVEVTLMVFMPMAVATNPSATSALMFFSFPKKSSHHFLPPSPTESISSSAGMA